MRPSTYQALPDPKYLRNTVPRSATDPLCPKSAAIEDLPIWLSKWMTLTGPHFSRVDRSADSVVVWSPPRVMIRGVV